MVYPYHRRRESEMSAGFSDFGISTVRDSRRGCGQTPCQSIILNIMADFTTGPRLTCCMERPSNDLEADLAPANALDTSSIVTGFPSEPVDVPRVGHRDTSLRDASASPIVGKRTPSPAIVRPLKILLARSLGFFIQFLVYSKSSGSLVWAIM